MATPTSQKADQRPISFVLQNGQTGESKSVPLVIRPEELTRPEPMMLQPVQTFGGAFIDDFGRGLADIQISGHTGWRGADAEDGGAAFKTLRDTIWTGWADARQTAVDAGQKADSVKLIFSDALDDITVVVAPRQFVLRRSRQRPLLMMYQISMTVLSDRLDDPGVDPLDLSGAPSASSVIAGAASLQSSVGKIAAAIDQVHAFVDGAIAAPVQAFMQVTHGAFQSVLGVVDTAGGIVSGEAAQLVGVARDLAQAGRNMFNIYNAIISVPDEIRSVISEVASAYEDAFCVLSNAFRPLRTYQDYSDLYGSSSCSSTVGGSPISPLLGVNSWEAILPDSALGAGVSQVARGGIEAMKAADAVFAPFSLSDLGARAAIIAGGVTI